MPILQALIPDPSAVRASQATAALTTDAGADLASVADDEDDIPRGSLATDAREDDDDCEYDSEAYTAQSLKNSIAGLQHDIESEIMLQRESEVDGQAARFDVTMLCHFVSCECAPSSNVGDSVCM